jgi:DNA-binding XRE family transcriptional regulator
MASRPHIQFIAGPDGRPAFAVLDINDYYALLEGVGAPQQAHEPPSALPNWAEPPPPPAGIGAEFEMPPMPPQPEREPMPDAVRARIDGGENPIVVWREYRELTQEALAGFIGFQEDDIQAFESGEITPSVEICQMLAMALDVDFEDVIPI